MPTDKMESVSETYAKFVHLKAIQTVVEHKKPETLTQAFLNKEKPLIKMVESRLMDTNRFKGEFDNHGKQIPQSLVERTKTVEQKRQEAKEAEKREKIMKDHQRNLHAPRREGAIIRFKKRAGRRVRR